MTNDAGAGLRLGGLFVVDEVDVSFAVSFSNLSIKMMTVEAGREGVVRTEVGKPRRNLKSKVEEPVDHRRPVGTTKGSSN